MIITIDGPAGAGKSSAARGLAAKLGYHFLDTGAMYRAVALAGLHAGIDMGDESHLTAMLPSIQIEMPPEKVILNGKDVSDAIRTAEITRLSRAAADSPTVRRFLSKLQRQFAEGKNVVTEGRDQGTIVFPDAECKFFLTASPEARAERRHQEMLARGETISLEEVLRTQNERDARDAVRTLAPMKPAADATTVDSTGLSSAQVVAVFEKHVQERQRGEAPA